MGKVFGAQTDARNDYDNMGVSNAIPIDKRHAEDITRAGGCELHNVSSLLGGVASQEVIKLLTNQFTPMNNTYVYNGISGCGDCYQL